MHQYGPTLLTEKCATVDDLSQLVICTPELPDVSRVVDGTVMQLTKSQRGYTATHFYKVKDGVWVDVSAAYGPADNRDYSRASYQYEIFVDEELNESFYTGYLILQWKHLASHPEAGDLVYEAVVRKLDTYPSHPMDGQILVRQPKTNVTNCEYKYYDEAIEADFVHRYKYTVFHVYASGWWLRTNI